MIVATRQLDCPELTATVYPLATWECCARSPGESAGIEVESDPSNDWIPATAPGTVAGALRAAGRWSFENPLNLDAAEWCYRTKFSVAAAERTQRHVLRCDGLATLAEIWLNGRRIAATDNMFRRYAFDVTEQLQDENELLIVFRSLTEDLKRKRPRPRWKTSLVAQQQLRWQRTSLLGRIPGWAPVAPIVGPWRGVHLESSSIVVENIHIVPSLDGTTGRVCVEARVRSAEPIDTATVTVGDMTATLQATRDGDAWQLQGEVTLADVAPWRPHTHGRPELYPCTVDVGSAIETRRIAEQDIGFRTLAVRREDGFAVEVNGETIFCRGACWTVGDLLAPGLDEAALRRDLQLARDAGVNMLRVGGTMTYESAAFYRLCDELGILVWQDFMFANMDYPVGDPEFAANVTAEATEQLTRLAAHPCVVVYCGNSEIEQQAAMLGLPRELWTNDWFAKQLPELCATFHPGTAYIPSTPTGGALPFQTRSGLTHYYGVGAYLRSPDDVGRADVRFTPECLGFANVPEQTTVDEIFGGGHPVLHDPRWKRRVPRDGGAGWDFEDVRDHYLRELFDVDPVELRSFDMPRYLKLSRLAASEMMARVFAEWRSGHSRCGGGLVWFYKDLWPGAGWGIVDAHGLPKAAYYHLKRVWQPRQLVVTDEGLNGLDVHLINETDCGLHGSVEVALWKEPHTLTARQEMPLEMSAKSRRTVGVEEILGRFYDVAYAYRFGSPQHDVVAVTWFDADRNVVSEAHHQLRRSARPWPFDPRLQATAEALEDGAFRVQLQSDSFLSGVHVTAKGYLPDDNYFSIVPQRAKAVTFRPLNPAVRPPFRATVEATNYDTVATVSAG
jgi:beta-mannosidase